MQKMLKGGSKHARVIYDTCSKLSIGTQKRRYIFSTFNNSRGVLIDNFQQIYSTASGVLSFSIHHFFVSIYNQSKRTLACIWTFEKKQIINECCKENHRRKTNYLIGECVTSWVRFCITLESTQPAFTFSKLTIETLEQGVKYVQS